MINKYPIIGIDEAGRGPIAGPVAVCAFLIFDKKGQEFLRGARDSKKVSEKNREKWFEKILKAKDMGLVDFSVRFSSEKVIDKKGIVYAIKSALEKALSDLESRNSEKEMYRINERTTRGNFFNFDKKKIKVFLDGGLHAPLDYFNQETVIKGDDKIQAISLASICAKVLRDRRMKRISKKYAKYKFEVHKGYGTRLHYKMISENGLCPLHRKSFLKSLIGKDNFHVIAKK